MPLVGTSVGSAVVTPINTPVTLSAQGSIAIPAGAQGYIVVRASDSTSGLVYASLVDLITDLDRANGFKPFSLVTSNQFGAAVSLQVATSAQAPQGSVTVPTLGTPTLASFTVQ